MEACPAIANTHKRGRESTDRTALRRMQECRHHDGAIQNQMTGAKGKVLEGLPRRNSFLSGSWLKIEINEQPPEQPILAVSAGSLWSRRVQTKTREQATKQTWYLDSRRLQIWDRRCCAWRLGGGRLKGRGEAFELGVRLSMAKPSHTF